MHKFRYQLGHTAFETATVAELVEALQKFPPDMPVLATWEGVVVPFKSMSQLEMAKDFHMGQEDDKRDVLMLDVDK